MVGYHRYDTAAELLLLNKIWELQSQITNYLLPQQKLISKVRTARRSSRNTTADHPATSGCRRHPARDEQGQNRSSPTTSPDLNPAAIQRQIQALTNELLTLTTSKGARFDLHDQRPLPARIG